MNVVKNLTINKNATIKETMKLLDTNGAGIVFIVSKDGKLSGVVTDGDIRRAIEKGASSSFSVSEIMSKRPISIKTGENLKEASIRLTKKVKNKEKSIGEPILSLIIPIIDSKRVLQNLVVFYPESKRIEFINEKNSPQKNNIKRVLIVGGAGYLGSETSRLLLKKGYRVRVLDNLSFGIEPISDLMKSANFELIVGDMRDIKIMNKALDNIDAVIHLAAIVGDPASKKYPEQTITTNYLATMTLALACKYRQINKFIFASTCSVYGLGDDKLDENSPLNPVSLYARTKIESEKGILNLADENFQPVIMRMSTLFGLSSRMRFDLVVNTFSKMSATEGKITIFGGDQWRPLLHVKDAAMAYYLILKSPLKNVDNHVFNVGSNEFNFTINQLGELLKSAFPNTKVEYLAAEKDAIKDKRSYVVSFDKIKSILKFTPKRDILSSYLEIHQAIKSGNIENVHDDKYYNCIF